MATANRLRPALLSLLLLLTPALAQAAPVAARDVAAVLEVHERAVGPAVELFRAPAEVELMELQPADGLRLSFHWQDGLYREEYDWLGFAEVYGYDGREHWYGSSTALPYLLDDSRPPSITLELIRSLAYLRTHRAHVGAAPGELPPLELSSYDVLRFAPPKMNEALLLLDPHTALLAGAVVGDAQRLADSHGFTLLSFEQWRDFAGVPYAGLQRWITFDGSGRQLRERERRVEHVGAAAALERPQFTRASSPQPPHIGAVARAGFELLSGTPVVTCTGPDGEPLRMLVDTGASVGLLRSDVAERLGLTPVGAQHISGHGGTARVAHVRAPGVVLGEAELPAFPAAVLLDSPPRGMESQLRFAGIDGILGNFLLAGAVLRIDYAARELTLTPPEQFAATDVSASAHVLELNRAQLPWVRVEVDGRIKGGAFVNTGGNYVFSLAVHAIDAAGIVYPVESLGSSVVVHGPALLGVIRPREVRLPALSGGPLVLAEPTTALDLPTPGEPLLSQRAASLGNGLLSRYRVTFDLRGGRLYLEP